MTFRVLLAASILAVGSVAAPAIKAQNSCVEAPAVDPVEILRDIEARVDEAALLALIDNDFGIFDQIKSDLGKLDTRGVASLENYRTYWLSYALYQESIAHLRMRDMEATEQALSQASAALSQLEIEDGEVETLRSLVTGLQLIFVPPQDVLRDAQVSQQHLDAGMRQGPTIRSYYALAIADWNTPSEYGGRTKAEAALREGLELPNEANGRLKPSWGRDQAHALLIQILYTTSRVEEAGVRLVSAIEMYPDSVALRELIRMKKAQ
ncbi:MAG: hypothetical protein ABJF50_13385 [Paracoccaceae bacterium]